MIKELKTTLEERQRTNKILDKCKLDVINPVVWGGAGIQYGWIRGRALGLLARNKKHYIKKVAHNIINLQNIDERYTFSDMKVGHIICNKGKMTIIDCFPFGIKDKYFNPVAFGVSLELRIGRKWKEYFYNQLKPLALDEAVIERLERAKKKDIYSVLGLRAKLLWKLRGM